MNEIFRDLSVALIQLACSWIGAGLLFSLIFYPFVIGPYRWARFRYFNVPRKVFVWLKRSWRLIVLWPFEAPRLVLVISGDRKFCYDEDLLYHLPLSRLIGYVKTQRSDTPKECFYQIGDRYIRGTAGEFFFCKSEDVVVEMMSNPDWVPPKDIDRYVIPRFIPSKLTEVLSSFDDIDDNGPH
jgi:hypothetical protein